MMTPFTNDLGYGWKLKSIEREFDEYETQGGEIMLFQYWSAFAIGPNKEELGVTRETKEQAVQDLIKIIETGEYLGSGDGHVH